MSWSVDTAQLTFAWVCFIGADLALARNRHMGVDMLLVKCPERMQLSIMLFNSILMLAFLLFVAVYGIDLCIINRQRSFQTLPISYSFATASAPVGAILMILTLTKVIVGTVKDLLNTNSAARTETV